MIANMVIKNLVDENIFEVNSEMRLWWEICWWLNSRDLRSRWVDVVERGAKRWIQVVFITSRETPGGSRREALRRRDCLKWFRTAVRDEVIMDPRWQARQPDALPPDHNMATQVIVDPHPTHEKVLQDVVHRPPFPCQTATFDESLDKNSPRNVFKVPHRDGLIYKIVLIKPDCDITKGGRI